MQIHVRLQIRRFFIPALVCNNARHDLADIALIAKAVVVAAGNVELAGAWEGTVTCKTNNGKIQVTAPKPESAYRVEAHTDNGSVYVNDNKVLNPYTAQNTQADTNLYAVSNNGSVRLEFAN